MEDQQKEIMAIQRDTSLSHKEKQRRTQVCWTFFVTEIVAYTSWKEICSSNF
jgi:hypothetical protein